ncbi:MAG: DNA adenine methylase [Spirochaetales bacterium]|nr:DNA adenine methylase [Spirochaetales bacterium]
MSILNEAYLKEQLITYIGNKRRLLPLIHQGLVRTSRGIETPVFTDLFAGSGVVSRLARLMGFRVYSNDWEEYSRILGLSHLTLNRKDLIRLFGSFNTLESLLYDINNLPEPQEEERYMSLFYSPSDKDVAKADYRVERLFYTRENALRIDGIRNYIENRFPPDSTGEDGEIRTLLIGLLLGECSRHTNTSGVFKAFHKGFGGHGKDALQRILKPIELPFPVLPEDCIPAQVFCTDANELAASRDLPDADICYLDPPYNQHQYGSNYHILNTIALWDKIPAPLTLNEYGILKEKAAIRKDWIKTRSPYCYKSKADQAFSELLSNTRARHILISYSNDGVIPFDTMMDICEQKGRVSIISNEYTKFRGGRQSNHRLHSNIEFILDINCSVRANSYSRSKINKLLLLREIALLDKKIYMPEQMETLFHGRWSDDGLLHTEISGNPLTFRLKDNISVSIESDIRDWSISALKRLVSLMNECSCQSRYAELQRLFALMNKNRLSHRTVKKEVPRRIRMLAHKKTKSEYKSALETLESLRNTQDLGFIDNDLRLIKIQAEKRFND